MVGPDEVYCGWCEDPFEPYEDTDTDEPFCSHFCQDKATEQYERELEEKAQGPRLAIRA